MTSNNSFVEQCSHFIHKHFLVILICVYLLAASFPQPGLMLRAVELGQVKCPDGSAIKITLSLLMLSFLLLNAGLGIKTRELTSLWQRPGVILTAFIANMAVPIILIATLGGAMQLWHNPDELQNLLVGLAMIISMPIAGSSAAWAQNANGNLSLSLGLVFLSTVLSLFTTPLVLHLFGLFTTGDYSEDLHEIASQGTNMFLMLTVVLPSVAGIFLHFLLGEKKTALLKPHFKLCNFVVLLLLNYSNAATSLPQALRRPDWDFLFLILTATILLCGSAFGAGWLLSKAMRTDKSDQAALMFGLGMNNNGTGLVLATATLADHPAVLLPMIFYTLVQQIIAAIVDLKVFKGQES